MCSVVNVGRLLPVRLGTLVLTAALAMLTCTTTSAEDTDGRSARAERRKAESVEAQRTRSIRVGTQKRSPARMEIIEETGFTIIEEVRASGDVRAEYDNAIQYLERDLYASGISLLVQVTEKAPDVTSPFIDLGIAYSRSGDLVQAEASLQRALELNPAHPIAHNELGMLYRKTGRFKEARASYEQALEVYPDFHFARRNLAILCDLYLRDLSCALENYEAYRAIVPDDQEVGIWIADLRSRAGR